VETLDLIAFCRYVKCPHFQEMTDSSKRAELHKCDQSTEDMIMLPVISTCVRVEEFKTWRLLNGKPHR
jgi:hypothetical protein